MLATTGAQLSGSSARTCELAPGLSPLVGSGSFSMTSTSLQTNFVTAPGNFLGANNAQYASGARLTHTYTTPVPEAGTAALTLLGLLGMAVAARARQRG